jgi:pimeloyl-ACP methyl ester carboxylesterase
MVAALSFAATAPTLERPAPALAYCNGVYPGKITNDVQERLVPFSMGAYCTDIFVREVRPPRRRVYGGSVAFPDELPSLPPVLLVGVPGAPYDYCENLEALVLSGRRVFAVNTCEAPVERGWLPPRPKRGPREARRPAVAARQLLAVCEASGLGAVHVFAHGLGGAAALHLVELLRQPVPAATAAAATAAAAATTDATATTAAAATLPPSRVRLASLILASPYGALEDLRPVQQRRLQNWDELFPIDMDEEGGSDGTESGGQQCIVEANALTGRPWREALLYASEEESRAESLGRGQLAPRLPDASVPTMLLRGGSADPVEPSWDLSDRTDVKMREYMFSGHLPFIDNREEVLFDLLAHLDAADGVSTNRNGVGVS